MSLTVRCPCGAQYRVADDAIGRRATCKECGSVFELQTGTNPAAPNRRLDPKRSGGRSDVDAQPDEERVPAPPIAVAPLPAVAAPREAGASAAVASPAPGPWRGFVTGLTRAVLFPARRRNLWVFLVAWLVLSVGHVGGSMLLAGSSQGAAFTRSWTSISPRLLSLAVLAYALTEGAFAALSFQIVQRSAEGADDLPGLPLTDDLSDAWDELVAPLLLFCTTCLLAVTPALIFVVAVALIPSLGELAPPTRWAALTVLLLLGLGLWPMVVLALALGGGAAVMRVGGMIRTITETFAAYGCTVLLVYGCAALAVWMATRESRAATGVEAAVVVVGLRTYTQIAAMRAIGTYYHHFEERFPWL